MESVLYIIGVAISLPPRVKKLRTNGKERNKEEHVKDCNEEEDRTNPSTELTFVDGG